MFCWLGIGCAVVVFLGSRVFFCLKLEPIYTDIHTYMSYGVSGVDLEGIPYVDFPMEYPPAAYYVFALPRWLDSKRLTKADLEEQVTFGPAMAKYYHAFRVEMLICDVAAFVMFMFAVYKRRPLAAGWAGMSYALSTGILCHVLYDRFDAGLLLIFMLWVLLTVLSWGVGRWPTFWQAAAYAVFGLGVAYKLLPIVSLPLLALADLKLLRTLRDVLRTASAWIAFALSLVVTCGWSFYTAGWDVLDFLRYHGERGIEVESVYASILFVLGWFDWPMRAFHDYGCWNIESVPNKLSNIMASASTGLVLLSILLAAGWLFFQPRQRARVDGYRLALWGMIASVTFAKVLSVQFFVWLLPLILLLGIDTFHRWELAILFCLSIVLASLTTWMFPYHFTPHYISHGQLHVNASDFALIPDLGVWACASLVVRNALLLIAVAWTGFRITRPKFDNFLSVTADSAPPSAVAT
jgi:hypothetical protein